MCMVETPYTSFMNEDLEEAIKDIKYTLDSVIGLVALMMLLQIIIMAFLVHDLLQ